MAPSSPFKGIKLKFFSVVLFTFSLFSSGFCQGHYLSLENNFDGKVVQFRTGSKIAYKLHKGMDEKSGRIAAITDSSFFINHTEVLLRDVQSLGKPGKTLYNAGIALLGATGVIWSGLGVLFIAKGAGEGKFLFLAGGVIDFYIGKWFSRAGKAALHKRDSRYYPGIEWSFR